MVDGGKITNQQNLERVAQQTGQSVESLLAIPEVKDSILYLWGWFCQIKGAEPLTYFEIEAWNNLKGHGITPEEVEVLMILDADFYQTRSNGS